MKKKKVVSWFILLSFFFGIFIYFYFVGKNNNDKLYKSKINSLIVKRNNWQVRATEFYLSNGLFLDSTYQNNHDLRIGDSIVKEANSSFYNVYRKNGPSGNYYFLIQYENGK